MMTELPLVQNAKYFITHSLATKYGILNGSEVQLDSIITHDYKVFNINNNKNIEFELDELPACLLLKKFNCKNNSSSFAYLPSDLIPIFPREESFSVDPKCPELGTRSGSVKRVQFPLTPAYASTAHKAQSKTLSKAIIDLSIPPTGRLESAYAYVVLSRLKCLNSLTLSPHLELNSRYLPDISIPTSAQLMAIKSAKGTGKTEFLAKIVKQAVANQQKVLVIGHRVKLVEELCQRFGLNYISKIIDNPAAQIYGYGLCIDSLHPQSQAKFQAEDWQEAMIIIDEIEQVLWHGLNGDTCKTNRVAILKSLKSLLQTVVSSGGKVLVADADLSDISLDYLTSLAAIELETFLISNEWKPSYQEAWRVYNYSDNTPQRLVNDLVKHIKDGGKPFVCLSAQKLTSKWGTITLESYLKKQFPHKKVLRIDSESLQDSSHAAYQAIGNLNQLLLNYDIVLASPAIETGISIDIQQHFTSVWCLAQGIQTPTSIAQFLGRIRENIPRYIWSAVYGFNQVGNGSTSIPKLLTSGHRLTEVNIRLLHQSDLESLEDLDTTFQAESLLCWAKMAVRVNAYMLNYRHNHQKSH